MKKFLYIVVVLVLLSSGQLFAQTGFYLALDGGISSQKLSVPDFDFDSDSTFAYGFRAGFRVLFLAIEGQYLQASHNLTVKDFPDINWDDRKVRYNYLGLNGKLFLPIPIVAPYILFGYGYYTADIKDLDKDRNTSWNVGLGLQIKLHKHFAISGDGRYHPSTEYLIAEEDVKVRSYTLTAGLNFYF
jgi:opacity protein-like surface antigen